MVKPVVLKKRKLKRVADGREVGEPAGRAIAESKRQDKDPGSLEPYLDLEDWGFDDVAGF
jgi:hypothetical protein